MARRNSKAMSPKARFRVAESALRRTEYHFRRQMFLHINQMMRQKAFALAELSPCTLLETMAV
jgi:hypothetical protein